MNAEESREKAIDQLEEALELIGEAYLRIDDASGYFEAVERDTYGGRESHRIMRKLDAVGEDIEQLIEDGGTL